MHAVMQLSRSDVLVELQYTDLHVHSMARLDRGISSDAPDRDDIQSA